jgi:hypothetical protein
MLVRSFRWCTHADDLRASALNQRLEKVALRLHSIAALSR